MERRKYPGTKYLVTSLLGAVNTANAYRPLLPPGLSGMFSTMAGPGPSECPSHPIAVQAIGAGAADPSFQPGFESDDTVVDCVVPFFGVYHLTHAPAIVQVMERTVLKTKLADGRDLWEPASPIRRLVPHTPPMMVLHGTSDSFIDVGEGRIFADAVRRVSKNSFVYQELPRALHAFDVFSSVRAFHAVHAVERFLNFVRSGRQVVAAAS